MLVKDAKSIALKSLSMWANYLGICALAWPEVRYLLFEIDTNPALMWHIGFWLIVAGTVGRLVNQGLSGGVASKSLVRVIWVVFGGLIVALLMTATPSWAVTDKQFSKVADPLVAKFEGKRNQSYKDIVGVWTICYGHTKTARPNQYKSDRECADLLAVELLEYRHNLHVYFAPTTRSRLTANRDAAYVSLAYNVGVRGAGKSTATRRLNAGNLRGGCHALAWWNKAGGRVVRGLVIRRSVERDLCLLGL
ncbi:MAG: lysozyme [Gammaproteobacteria bacterium]|nr:lysozyme [Gammaproteobacteria bacterium]